MAKPLGGDRGGKDKSKKISSHLLVESPGCLNAESGVADMTALIASNGTPNHGGPSRSRRVGRRKILYVEAIGVEKEDDRLDAKN
jgi:hypothetical protein